MIIVDVGACVGEFTDHCLEAYDVEKIIMVEPLNENVNYLLSKYRHSGILGTKVFVLAGAMSDYNGSGVLYPKIKFARIKDKKVAKALIRMEEHSMRLAKASDDGYYSGKLNTNVFLHMPADKYFKGLNTASRYAGNAGSCLNMTTEDITQNNHLLGAFYDPRIQQEVRVGTVGLMMNITGIDRIDILKLDVEGCEYKILENVLEEKLHEKIDQIFFEDHLDKMPGMLELRSSVLKKIKDLGIEDKFLVQEEHLTYDVPLVETEMWKEID